MSKQHKTVHVGLHSLVALAMLDSTVMGRVAPRAKFASMLLLSRVVLPVALQMLAAFAKLDLQVPVLNALSVQRISFQLPVRSLVRHAPCAI
jgi:hypothetical protein